MLFAVSSQTCIQGFSTRISVPKLLLGLVLGGVDFHRCTKTKFLGEESLPLSVGLGNNDRKSLERIQLSQLLRYGITAVSQMKGCL
jgi:hypothetical protein